MDDYSINFGKLAYIKTEDLNKRILAIEGKSYENFTSIYFNRKDINAASETSVKESFLCQTQTDVTFSLVISTDGGADLSIYLNGIFLFGERISGGGEKTFGFEARGLEAGENTLELTFSNGGTVLYYELSASGNKINYTNSQSKISHAKHMGEDYVFWLNGGELKLFKVVGESLTDTGGIFPPCLNCCAFSYQDKLLLFFTVWDGTLFYCQFSQGAFSNLLPLFFGVGTFTAAQSQGLIHLYFSQSGRFMAASGFLQDGLILSDAYQTGINKTEECAATVKDGFVYLVCADSKERSRVYISKKTLKPDSQTLNFSLENISQGV